MKYINFKNGSVLSIIVTIFVMVALVCASLILLLKNDIIYINPEYLSSSTDNNLDNNKDNENNNIVISDYEGIIKGTKLKQLLQDISTQNLNNIIVYISENFVIETNATKENANVILMTNARITNSTEYTKIVDEGNYKTIIEKNNVGVVERIYVIKINNNI